MAPFLGRNTGLSGKLATGRITARHSLPGFEDDPDSPHCWIPGSPGLLSSLTSGCDGRKAVLVRWIMHVSQRASTASAYGLAGSTPIALAHSVCKSRCVSSRVSLERFASAAQASYVPNNALSPRGCRGLSQHPISLESASQRVCHCALSVSLL